MRASRARDEHKDAWDGFSGEGGGGNGGGKGGGKGKAPPPPLLRGARVVRRSNN